MVCPKHCEVEGCEVKPLFNLPGNDEAKRCSKHKNYGMINVKEKYICIEDNCNTGASFNFADRKVPIYCTTHKMPDMVDIRYGNCNEPGCYKYASYNFVGKTKRLYCPLHKKADMVYIKKHFLCIEPNCKTHASCNFPTETIRLYCSIHSKDGMINLTYKKTTSAGDHHPRTYNKRQNGRLCIEPNCKTHASYNFPTETSRIYCSKHSKDGMINLCIKKHKKPLKQKKIILHNKGKCNEPNCKVSANYNYPNETLRIYCKAHMKDGMVNVANLPCREPGCSLYPIFNFPNTKNAIYCKQHMLDGMVDIKHKVCKSEFCNNIASYNKIYENYCRYCFVHLFPDKPTIKNYKTKENLVVSFVKDKFPDISWIHDKKIADGCSKRRPDLFADFGEFVLIIEIDEYSHKDYDNSCENKRLMELFQDSGANRPLSIIRFNPDSFISDGKKIPSCFSLSKDGLLRVKNNNLWNNRLNSLQNCINNSLSCPDKEISIQHLFFS